MMTFRTPWLGVAALVALCCSCNGSDDLPLALARPMASAHAAVAMDTSPALASVGAWSTSVARGERGERGVDFDAVDARESSTEEEIEHGLVPRGSGAHRSSTRGRLSPPSLMAEGAPPTAVASSIPPGSAEVEQRSQGTRAPAEIVASFDGLGAGFRGPQGTATLRNPSDNTLAVGPNHIVQLVNSRMAVFTKRGARYDTTGRVLYGPVASNNVFKGFGGPCDERLSGDAVVRYDQLAHRWLIVLPIFSRVRQGERHAPAPRAGEGATESERGQDAQPGAARELFQPPPPPTDSVATARPPATPRVAPDTQGVYAMCYAVSTSEDPLGSY